MVGLDTIAEAIRDHHLFPWPLVQRLYHTEWTAALNALQAVAANPHHGYKGDTTAVKSANYRNISWICGRLLISLGNDSLKNYRGFKEDPRTKVAVEKMISDYITHGMGDDDASVS
ncbi:hypothetical protein CesoFtcFv8_008150 [Champsocephalus esox]|uniref:Uncharacterized protein n=1 Tax=Champsocephalus esox TaxID=159716 RepID=A0AAN8CG61_9TELE|nr:hypothetical protein CesoFtcFv8_008150 [Champsocephalus esox]